MNSLEYIQKSQTIHGDVYDYSKTIFTDLNNFIKITCHIHGEFEIRAKYHIYQKRGCQKCAHLNKLKALRMTTESFIEKAKGIHGDMYDYGSVNYINSRIKVDIICSLHGVFQQLPDSHLQNHGCPKCNTDRKKVTIFSVDEIKARFREVHGDTYDYSLINEYIGITNPLNVICKVHGVFATSYIKHYHHQSGCSNCNGGVLLSKDIVIERFKSVHGDLYNYSEFIYVDAHTKGIIICPIHGKFSQSYTDHYLLSHKCPGCAGVVKLTNDDFISRALLLHNDKYDYSKTNYISSNEKVLVTCKEHGDFEVFASNHTHKQSGCPKCSNHISKAQIEIYEFVKSFDNSTILEDRESYSGLFLDIFIPNKKLVIEYNGCYWHAINNSKTTRFKKPSHLYDKMKQIQSHGLRVINIYEDEWLNNRMQIEQIIKNALGVIDYRIYARKCSIYSIETNDPRWEKYIKPFFNKYHHQGLNYKPNGIAYCLIYNKQIQACAYFGETKYHNQSECELIRFATRLDIKVVGGLSKLVKNFLKCNPQVKSISSFCDARFFTGDGYIKAGFKFISHSPPGFDVIIPNNNGMMRKHRSIIIKNKLVKYFSQEELQTKTQMELAENIGWYCVPDCGQLLFKF